MSEHQNSRTIVIGASAAGLRAAARAHRLLPAAEVIVIDQGTFISYSACGMPYFVSGDIHSADKLRETPYGLIRDPDYFKSAKDIEVILETVVERIDRNARKVFCRSTQTGEASEYSYDKLVLATGARPIIPDGIPPESKRVNTFKTLQDAINLRESLQKREIKKAAIIGGGSTGCELTEAFSALWGAEVVLIEAMPNILPGMLDPEMASAVETYMRSEGIEVRTNCPLEEIVASSDSVTIKTPQGDFEVDRAVLAVGVRPNSGLAADCGLSVGSAGGIVVDERMLTSDPDIYAAGDCVEVKHLISGKTLQLPLGSLANRQGRIVGSNLGGGDERFGPVVGSSAVKIFDMNIASTGLTEGSARDSGFNTGCAWGTFNDKPDYYPEAQNIHLKLLFDRESGRLLGLQGYGKGEVVKRVDIFANLLKNQGQLEDLLDVEYAHAPPYSPGVDPLYSLACAARNAMLEDVEAVPPTAPLGDRIIIDVRQDYEVESTPLPIGQALNIPLEEIRKRYDEIPKDKPVVCICSKGLRSGESSRILKNMGLSGVTYLGGGFLMTPKE